MKQSFSQMSESVESIRTNAFRDGAQACREMLARFVEQGGDLSTANSIRQNWNPEWGADPGRLDTAMRASRT